jgi:hypothetical protein
MRGAWNSSIASSAAAMTASSRKAVRHKALDADREILVLIA